MKYLIMLVLITTLIYSSLATADVMTVKQLKEMIDKGPVGKAVAVAYVNGAVDGMVGLDFLKQKERGDKPEFCKFGDAKVNKTPLRNPAYRTEDLVNAWEKDGAPMDTPAVDFVLAFLSAQYGCKK